MKKKSNRDMGQTSNEDEKKNRNRQKLLSNIKSALKTI